MQNRCLPKSGSNNSPRRRPVLSKGGPSVVSRSGKTSVRQIGDGRITARNTPAIGACASQADSFAHDIRARCATVILPRPKGTEPRHSDQPLPRTVASGLGESKSQARALANEDLRSSRSRLAGGLAFQRALSRCDRHFSICHGVISPSLVFQKLGEAEFKSSERRFGSSEIRSRPWRVHFGDDRNRRFAH